MLKKLCIRLVYLVLFSSPFCLLAQDIISTTHGDTIRARVLEIRLDDVKYKLFDSTNSAIHTIKKSEIRNIAYRDGSVDYFSNANYTAPTPNPATTAPTAAPPSTAPPVDYPQNNAPANVSANEIYYKGMADAERYYKGYKTAGTVTLIAAIITSPLGGLLVAVPCAAVPPTFERLSRFCPHPDLLRKDHNYFNGFKVGAARIKSRKVWTNYGIGSGAYLLLVILSNSK